MRSNKLNAFLLVLALLLLPAVSACAAPDYGRALFDFFLKNTRKTDFQ